TPTFNYAARTGTLSAYGINPTDEPWGAFYAGANFQSLVDTIFRGRIEISRAIPRSEVPVLTNFADSTQRANVISRLYALIREKKAAIIFPEFEDKRYVRENIILPYMKEITNNRTFVDIGDDDGNGVVDETNSIVTTEKLINGLDYYYRILAYDEGDYRQQTPGKYTPSVTEANIIRATPLAARAGKPAEVTITSQTEDLLGGVSNFRFIVQDQDRLRQLYAGHELEVEFQPAIFATGYLAPANGANGIYGSNIIFRNITTGQVLAEYQTFYEPTPCGPIIGTFAENAGIFAGCDTCEDRPIGIDTSTLTASRGGTFSTDFSCNAPNQFVNNALGFAFDYTFVQQGGIYRPFTATITNGDATPTVAQVSVSERAQLTQPVNGQWVTFNQGPVKYRVKFETGGQETLRLRFGRPAAEKDFVVSYLNVKVEQDTRETLPNGKVVGSTMEIPHTPLTVRTGSTFVDVRDVPTNSYNLSAYGWVDGDWDSTSTENLRRDAFLERQKQSTQEQGTQALPVGTQGRYYLTGQSVDGQNRVKFTHTLLGSGVTFGMDFANKYGRKASDRALFRPQRVMPQNDFEAGDEVLFQTFGGAAGLPKAGARIRAKVSDVTPLADVTDEMLEQVQVVPNPYYVTHSGQQSQYDAKIYFTKLPEKCTISIYTINGDLIRTIEHNEEEIPEANRTYRQGTNIWDLLSDNKQRSASQVLIAHVETPNGASTIVKFSIVTGGYRQVP
ncbi:MAG TPA: hypothetical protein VEC36_02890, partial [Patescibacteria group bacterium]|nr:hypothetical protein [Patescibacteria group bacterium]